MCSASFLWVGAVEVRGYVHGCVSIIVLLQFEFPGGAALRTGTLAFLRSPGLCVLWVRAHTHTARHAMQARIYGSGAFANWLSHKPAHAVPKVVLESAATRTVFLCPEEEGTVLGAPHGAVSVL